MRIIVINGANLNFLGIREKNIYGNFSYDELCSYIKNYSEFNDIDFIFCQSNIEGEIVNYIQEAYQKKCDAIVINPGAYTHTSVAIYDAIKAVQLPTIEIHISNIYSREEFRAKSITTAACLGQISGLGKEGYILAIKKLANKI